MAGTIIDALVVTLGLDTSDFRRGQRETSEGLDDTRKKADSTAKDMEAYGKKASSFFTSIGKSMLALAGIALSANGVKNFITDTTKSLVEMGVQAEAIDTNARALDGWAKSADAMGSSAGSMMNNLQKFQNSLSQFRAGFGSDETLQTLYKFSADTGTKFDVDNANATDVMKYLGDNWNKLTKDRQRYYQQQLGFDNATGQGLSSGELQKLQKELEATSKQSDAMTDRGRRLTIEFVRLRQSWEGASLTLYEKLLPAVWKILGVLDDLSKWVDQHGPEIDASFKELDETFSILWLDVKDVGAAIGDLLSIDTENWSLSEDIRDLNKNLNDARTTVELIIDAFKSLFNLDFSAFGEKVKTLFNMSDKKDDALPAVTNSANAAAEWFKEQFGWDPRDFGKMMPWNDDEPEQHGQSTKSDTSSGSTLADRNNNPGNIRPVGGNGFRFFETALHGWQAMKNQLLRYFDGKTTGTKLQTIWDIVKTWAPKGDGDNDPEKYAKDVAKWMGISTDTKLDLRDTGTMAKLMQAMARKEGYSQWNSPLAHQAAGNVRNNSLETGAKYMGQLLDRYGGDLKKALTAYNWGMGNLERKGMENAPAEARNYAPQIMARMNAEQRYSPQIHPQTGSAAPNITFQNTTIKTDAKSMQELAKDVARKGMAQSSLTQSFLTGQNS
ncbi:transglycosylase SLT domain-containing protein [Escherichia coli]